MKLPIGKIICGDCRKVMPKLPANSIDLIILDPPYLTTDEIWDKTEIITEGLIKELFRIAKPSCSLYCWCGIGEKSQSLIRWFPIFSKLWYFKDLITWKKQRGIGMKKGWLYTREEIMWFVKDTKKYSWDIKYQYNFRSRRTFTLPKNKSIYNRFSNIWIDIKETAGEMKSSPFGHFTIKPIKALQRIIKVHTQEGDIILDPFVGSGTTCVAAEQLGRKWIGIEVDKEYCKIARKRIAYVKRNPGFKIFR